MTYTRNKQLIESIANELTLFTNSCGGDPHELAEILHGRYTVNDFAYHDDMYHFGIMDYFKKTVIPHKIAVFEAGMELFKKEWFKNYMKAPDEELYLENLWLHDLSKFSANEAFGYALYNRHTGEGKEAFERAWHHHKMNNPHHPEHWFNPNRSGGLEPIPMPELYAMEMIADWIGAGKTYGSSLKEWLPDNLVKFRFGAATVVVKNILEELGINTRVCGGPIPIIMTEL